MEIRNILLRFLKSSDGFWVYKFIILFSIFFALYLMRTFPSYGRGSFGMILLEDNEKPEDVVCDKDCSIACRIDSKTNHINLASCLDACACNSDDGREAISADAVNMRDIANSNDSGMLFFQFLLILLVISLHVLCVMWLMNKFYLIYFPACQKIVVAFQSMYAENQNISEKESFGEDDSQYVRLIDI